MAVISLDTSSDSNSSTQRMPAIFIGHGSPMNIVLENEFTESIKLLGRKLPRPRAVMVISAHWQTRGTYVSCGDEAGQEFDFYGFPEELYDVTYTPKGSPEDARAVIELLEGVTEVKCDYNKALDHGSWSILKLLFPDADVPVFQMSIDHSKPVDLHYKFASRLAALRDRGVLIIGSGNIVHNLRMIDFNNINSEPYDWAVEFDRKVKENLTAMRHYELIGYLNFGKAATLAVPTPDHLLPLYYIIGMQRDSDTLNFVFEGFQNKSISMTSFMIG